VPRLARRLVPEAAIRQRLGPAYAIEVPG